MSYQCKTPEDVLEVIRDDKVAMIDLRFTDLPGLWQHFSVPPGALEPDSFTDGIGFDDSSIRDFQEFQESDMLDIPDPATTFLDPFAEAPTLVLIYYILDSASAQAYSRDARHIAQKAENYLRSTGIGDTTYLGPELEHSKKNLPKQILRGRVMAAVAGVALATAGMIGLPDPAFAHAHLTKATPADKATISTGPKELRLQFSEAVEPKFCTVTVTVDDGMDMGPATVVTDPKNHKVLIATLPGKLGAGTYKVEWHATSVDTHKTEGSYSFTVES
jgi:methionine-rich copper-binding protein CopC